MGLGARGARKWTPPTGSCMSHGTGEHRMPGRSTCANCHKWNSCAQADCPVCGSTAVPAAPAVTMPLDRPAPGETPHPIVGESILGERGGGGMGVVYQPRHLALTRVVALKMIRHGPQAGRDERARFR